MAKQETKDETDLVAEISEVEASGVERVEAPTMAELVGIRYIGKADVKRLSVLDILNAGVESVKSDEDLVWSRDNDFLIPAASVNAATRDLLATQPDFIAE